MAEETVGGVRRFVESAAALIKRSGSSDLERRDEHDREVHRLRYETPFYSPGQFPLSPESEAMIDKLLSTDD